MASKYPYARISSIVEKVGMGPFGSSIKVETFTDSGVPIINGQHLNGIRILDERFNFISEDHAKRLLNANVSCGDVVFTHRGNIGQVSYIPSTAKYQKYVVSQSQLYIRPLLEVVTAEYLTYYFRSPEGQRKLIANLSQTGVPAIAQPTTYVKSLEIPLPSLENQKAIGMVLGYLDDKIELNRQINEKLEAIAQALFKSWFVDFDPVRAKAEGRDTGLPEHISSLFPSSFVDSELGPIPEGWQIKSLQEICSVITRGVTPQYEDGSGIFIINQKVNRGSLLDMNYLKELSSTIFVPSEKYAYQWDVLINSLGEGTLGRVHLFTRKDLNFAIDQHITICRPIRNEVGPLIYYLLENPVGQARLDAMKTGSTGMTMLNISKLRNLKVLMPAEEPLSEAFKYFSSLLIGKGNNVIQDDSLRKLRDTLLPKLISGELSIPDAERIVGRYL